MGSALSLPLSMDWFSFNHYALVHLPVAAALLAPIALVASQRVGRGIRPWWTASRFVVLMGCLGILLSILSGYLLARRTGVLPAGLWLAPGAAGTSLPRLHQLLALASLALGLITLKAANRPRQDHQGIGVLPLLLGILWSGAVVCTGYFGGQMAHAQKSASTLPAVPAPALPPKDPEAEAPLRALDYARLEPAHLEPVKSPPHGNRWIRAWVTPSAGEAYAAGRTLPAGTMVVLSTMEDRWGRPSYDSGPLYILETLPGGRTSLAFYWPRVPEARRGETGGADHVYWRSADPALKACLDCHNQGIAPARDRSQWKVPRRPKPEESIPTEPDGGSKQP
jgi:hypothetical protein